MIKPDQKLIIDSSDEGLGLGWNFHYIGEASANSPFRSGSNLNNRYQGQPIYQIQKKIPTGHNGYIDVWAAGGGGWEAVWEPCTNSIFQLFIQSRETLGLAVLGEFAGVQATGRSVRVPYSVVYDLRGDQISAPRIYFPMSLLMDQLTT